MKDYHICREALLLGLLSPSYFCWNGNQAFSKFELAKAFDYIINRRRISVMQRESESNLVINNTEDYFWGWKFDDKISKNVYIRDWVSERQTGL